MGESERASERASHCGIFWLHKRLHVAENDVKPRQIFSSKQHQQLQQRHPKPRRRELFVEKRLTPGIQMRTGRRMRVA